MYKNEYMLLALENAKKAFENDEVPVGAVIVKDGIILASTYNHKEQLKDTTAHAEILAIREAEKLLDSHYLNDCDMYVTLEPCIMCAGAIIQARIRSVYFGAYDLKGGAFGSSIDVTCAHNINHQPAVFGGFLKEECSSLISDYFKRKRENK